jgi:hypothetical protein
MKQKSAVIEYTNTDKKMTGIKDIKKKNLKIDHLSYTTCDLNLRPRAKSASI